MITVSIGSSTAAGEQASQGWIAEQIRRRQVDGQSPCVRVSIRTGEVDLVLITKACGAGQGPAPDHSARERRIIDLWRRHVFDQPEIVPGGLIAFLQHLHREL